MRPTLPLAPLALLLVSGTPATAQNLPLQTEPATTAPAGQLVLESGFDAIADEPSYVTGARRTAWSGPLLRLVGSPAANVELDLEWVARVGVWGDHERGGAQSSDFGDVALRAKWRIAEGAGRPTLGARFGVFLPETSYEDKQFRPLGLGPNTLRFCDQSGATYQNLGQNAQIPFLHSFKLNTNVPLWYGVEVSASLQSYPGLIKAATGGVSWTIAPNMGAANATVADLYSYTGGPRSPWVFIGQYYNTFRIDATNP